MADHFGSLFTVWFFALLIGGAILANALVDLGVGPLKAWRSTRRETRSTVSRPGNGD